MSKVSETMMVSATFLSTHHACTTHTAMRQATVCKAATQQPDQATRIVAALGGNALLQRGQPLTMEAQAVRNTM